MDSQDRHESKIRRREETLARRVGEALDKLNPQGVSECPDAEIIAAYAEQALAPAESAQWEGHFAACARCRKILRVLAASAETPLAEKEVAQLGKLIADAQAPVEITARAGERAHPKLTDWRSRWLAPALGVAAVLVVWFAMRPPWRAPDRGASETLVARVPKEEAPLTPAPAVADRLSRVAPRQDQKRDQKANAAPPPDRSAANARSLNSPVEGLAKGHADASNALDKASASADDEANSLKSQEKKMSGLPGGREIQSPAIPPPSSLPPKPEGGKEASAAPQLEARAALGTPASAPLPQARAQANEAAPATPEVPRSTSQSVAVTETTPVVETTNGTLGGNIQQQPSANGPLNGRNYQALATLRPAPENAVLLKAPSGSTLWRAGKSGIIERSANSGMAWVTQKSPSQEDWFAGAAVSDTVCWVVGRNGAIARTVDGDRWERVVPPAQPAATAGQLRDWTGITARDARSATITASDGRIFSTADGGKTWQLE